MLVAAFLIISLSAGFFLLSRPAPRGLQPIGGRRIRIFIAWCILKLGSLKREDALGFEYANCRVDPLPGTDSENYNDSFVFQGSDRDGTLFMSRIGFRRGGKEAEVWLWMVLDGVKYVITQDLVETDPADTRSISAGGLQFRFPDESSSRCHIIFNGKVNPGKQPCRVDMTFTPLSAMYHSGIHFDRWSFARAMSEMPWSREYFSRLSTENQTRIEQGGIIEGVITVGRKRWELGLGSIRDHSWGKRDWRFINRYIWNIMAFQDDFIVKGKRFRYLVYTTVDYGSSFKHLVSGWIGGEDAILPIVEATDMGPLGVDGTIPEFFLLNFRPRGGEVMTIKYRRSLIDQGWITQGGGFEVNEAHCRVRIGVVRGSGMSEFGYAIGRGYHRPLDTL